jgi:hypothetical protein
MRRALKQGWNVPGEAKSLALRRMTEILEDSKAGGRSWVAVVKALVAMNQVTVSSIDCALRARRSDQPDDLDVPQAFDDRGNPVEP